MTDAFLTPVAKPRIAIMGEFSAGKSTLCNLLLKARPLPEKVTATRLSPVWMSKGPGRNHRVTLTGETEPVAFDDLAAIPFEDTRHIRLFLEADILDHCDFIDFPGISDPNMDASVWERVLGEADAVLWLTHATQAWRQTEAAVWETVPDRVRENSVLLVTRMDKLVSEIDQKRVLARLQKEAGSEFEAIFPISLTHAIAHQHDYAQWQASGAEAFMDHMVELIGRLSDLRNQSEEGEDPSDETAAPAPSAKVRRLGPQRPEQPEAPEMPHVVPRRVKPIGAVRRTRPGGLGLRQAGG